MKICYILSCSLLFSLILNGSARAQNLEGTLSDGRQSNSIKTAAPFLLITPDARSGAMGEVGVAISADANALHWNPSKIAFMENPTGFSLSYTPWLRSLVPDIDLGYFSIYHRLDKRNTIGGSLRYFSFGSIALTTEQGEDSGVYTPNEFAIDGAFARRFGDEFSLGTAFRYIRSSLSNGQFNGQEIRPVSALAADVSAYYKVNTLLFGEDADIALGLNISNIGTKVNYSVAGEKSFLPTNMKLGGSTKFILDDLSTFTLALDLNKLLVPTEPIRDENGNIIRGKDPNRSVPSAIFGSFSDAPGGFSEELKEISYSAGAEYWYNKQFALRAGYLYDSPMKGDRQFVTLGAGLKYSIFDLDFAYVMANRQKSPLAHTMRFSLVFNFEKR